MVGGGIYVMEGYKVRNKKIFGKFPNLGLEKLKILSSFSSFHIFFLDYGGKKVR